jgi:hypothetical protein
MSNERDDAQWKMLVMVQGDGDARETSTWNGMQNVKKGVSKLKPREEWESWLEHLRLADHPTGR